MADPSSYFMIITIIKFILLGNVSGYDYLIAFPADIRATHSTIFFHAGESGGRIQVQYPHQPSDGHLLLNNGRHIELVDAKMGITTGVENKSIVVICSDKSTKVLVYKDNFNYNIFYPLPVSKLRTRYLVSTCHFDGDSSFLVIATHDEICDINITRHHNPDQNDGTFRKSETTFLKLKDYQTFTRTEDFDLSGTLIMSSGRVAVFSGTVRNGKVMSYTQMYPMEQLGEEYVVSVDGSATYQLQITADRSNTRVTFNNGHEESIDTYRRNLSLNDNLYFKTSSPVMATICVVGEDRSITHIPPVSEYGLYREYPIYSDDKVMKFISDGDNQFYEDNTAWENITGTRFRVGTTRLHNDTMLNVVFKGLVMMFREHTAMYLPHENSAGLRRCTECEEYLLALPSPYPYITASTASTSGLWKVTYPDVGEKRNQEVDQPNVRELPPGSKDVFVINSDYETTKDGKQKVVLIEVVKNTEIHVSNFINMFSPLPVSALGTKYIINCKISEEMTEVLVIATYDQKTEVNIRFSDDSSVTHDGREYSNGDEWRVNLDEFDTLSIESTTFCGTRIESHEPIAVFLETKPLHPTSIYSLSSYEQVLPANLNGKEYIVSVDDPMDYSIEAVYSLHIYCESSATIKFNDEKEEIAFTNHYEKLLGHNTTVYFKTTYPVHVSLCRRSKQNNETVETCMIVPPKTLYRYDTILPINIPTPSSYKVLCKQNSSVGVVLQTGSILKQELPVTWEVIQGSEFKVGTFRFAPFVQEFRSNMFFRMTSEQRFAVLAFDQYSIFNGGYYVEERDNAPKSSGKENGSQISLGLAIGVSCCVIILLLAVVLAVSIYKWKRRRGRVDKYVAKEDKVKSTKVIMDAGDNRRPKRSPTHYSFCRNNFDMADDLRGTVKVSETFI